MNGNSRELITTTSTSPGTADPQAGSGWIDKLKSHSLKYLIFGSLARSNVFFSYVFPDLSPYSEAGTIPANKQSEEVEQLESSHHWGRISSFEELVANEKVESPYDERDLLDDESVRKLYERWLTHHGVARHPWKKEAHYQAFKKNAYRFYFLNKVHKDYRVGLSMFADMTEKDIKRNFHPIGC